MHWLQHNKAITVTRESKKYNKGKSNFFTFNIHYSLATRKLYRSKSLMWISLIQNLILLYLRIETCAPTFQRSLPLVLRLKKGNTTKQSLSHMKKN